MGEDFKRSRRFGLLGVGVVAVLAAAISVAFGDGARPTAALIAILALVFAFVAILLLIQRSDADRAEARTELAAAAAPDAAVEDPTMVETGALLHALAIRPLDDAALAAARARTWSFTRESIGSAGVIMALIFCAVAPWLLFQFAWSIAVFVPVIVAYALYRATRAVGAGGAMDQAYSDSAATLEPLGLRLTERPRVEITRRLGAPGRQASVEGAVAYAGERHGRPVTIRIEGSGARTTVGCRLPEFSVAARGERLQAGAGTPAAAAAVLEPLRASAYWRGVSAAAGPDGIAIERERDGGLHWMRDLWLAERLADAASPTADDPLRKGGRR